MRWVIEKERTVSVVKPPLGLMLDTFLRVYMLLILITNSVFTDV
jgi:hypothetical protein